MTPEGVTKKKIRALLKKYGPKIHASMPVQNGMGTPMLDYHLCVVGHYVAIEAKAEGGKVTERQRITIEQIRAAGGTVFVVSDGATLEALHKFLEALCADTPHKAVGCNEPPQPADGTEHRTDRPR